MSGARHQFTVIAAVSQCAVLKVQSQATRSTTFLDILLARFPISVQAT